MNDKFKCPECDTEWERNNHYKFILQSQNFINLLSRGIEIVDMCNKCNHMIEKEGE